MKKLSIILILTLFIWNCSGTNKVYSPKIGAMAMRDDGLVYDLRTTFKNSEGQRDHPLMSGKAQWFFGKTYSVEIEVVDGIGREVGPRIYFNIPEDQLIVSGEFKDGRPVGEWSYYPLRDGESYVESFYGRRFTIDFDKGTRTEYELTDKKNKTPIMTTRCGSDDFFGKCSGVFSLSSIEEYYDILESWALMRAF